MLVRASRAVLHAWKKLLSDSCLTGFFPLFLMGNFRPAASQLLTLAHVNGRKERKKEAGRGPACFGSSGPISQKQLWHWLAVRLAFNTQFRRGKGFQQTAHVRYGTCTPRTVAAVRVIWCFWERDCSSSAKPTTCLHRG